MASPDKFKRVQIVKEQDSYDAPPLDFSFKTIKNLRGNTLTGLNLKFLKIFYLKSQEKVKESQS